MQAQKHGCVFRHECPECYTCLSFRGVVVMIFLDLLDREQAALETRHPLDVEQALPKQLIESIKFNVESKEHAIIAERANFLNVWMRRARELVPAEASLKKNMETDVAEAVKGKRILVFEELLQSTGFPDLDIVDELRKGAELVGVVPETNMFPSKFVPAPGDTDIDKVVWKTLEEVNMGRLTGPIDADDVPAHHPVSKRFGLLQKRGKVRLIDDYTESEVNTCLTTMESPILHTVDVASAAISFWFGACSESGRGPKLRVRTFNLASAYRQVALSNGGQLFACIRVFNP